MNHRSWATILLDGSVPIEEIKVQLEALKGRIPGLEDIYVQAEHLKSSNANLMLDCTLTDEDALNGYAVHPDHVKVKDGLIGPNVKSRVCIDYEIR